MSETRKPREFYTWTSDLDRAFRSMDLGESRSVRIVAYSHIDDMPLLTKLSEALPDAALPEFPKELFEKYYMQDSYNGTNEYSIADEFARWGWNECLKRLRKHEGE